MSDVLSCELFIRWPGKKWSRKCKLTLPKKKTETNNTVTAAGQPYIDWTHENTAKNGRKYCRNRNVLHIKSSQFVDNKLCLPYVHNSDKGNNYSEPLWVH